MPHRPVIPSLWLLTAPLLLALACSHDSPRDNPLDPTLTPPVELQVTLDDTAGTATLTWTPYAGEQPFAEYRVLRNIAKSTEVDTLTKIAAVEQTTFVDRFLVSDTAYEYRVTVVNAGGKFGGPGRWRRARSGGAALPPLLRRGTGWPLLRAGRGQWGASRFSTRRGST